MANLGFVDTKGNIFHIRDLKTSKKKKDEEVPALAKVAETVNTKPKKEKTTQPTTTPSLELSYDTKGNKKTFDATKKQNKNIDVKSTQSDKNILDEIAFRGKNVGSGVLTGTTGIAQAPLQELQNDLQKGAQRDANWYNDPKNIALTTADTLLNPLLTMPIKRAYKELYDEEYKKKNFIEKALDNLNDIKEATMPTGLREAVKSYGAVDKQYLGGQAPENVQKLTEKISEPSKKVQEDLAKEAEGFSKYSQTMGNVWQQVGNMIPSIAATAITKDPNIGLGVMGASAKGMSTQEALEKGADLDTAIKIGDAKALTEILTEKMYGGIKIGAKSAFGKGALDETIEKLVNKNITKPFINFLTKQGVAVVGEMGEEVVSDVVDFLINKGTIDPNAKYTPEDLWNTLTQTGLSTVLLNFLGGGFGPSAYRNNTQGMVNQNLQQKALNQQAQQEVSKTKGDVISNLTGQSDVNNILNQQKDVVDNAIKQGTENFNLGKTNGTQQMLPSYNNQDLSNYESWYKNNSKELKTNFQNEYNQKITNKTAKDNTVYDAFAKNEYANQNTQQAATNEKINNFRQSLQKENILDKDGFYKSVEKIIQDKDYNVVMDSSITNQNGQPVDAQISNENGITIKINPNSPRAGEILLMHEVTHGIDTKEMSNLIMDYASKNPDFNNALDSLKRAYGTEDVTPEVVADISGQLFGNQEFISELSTQNPSLFKRIYNAIVSLVNKLTGNSNKERFIKDLKVKWENAYRKSNIESAQENLKNETKYSKNLDYNEMSFEDAMEGNFEEKKNIKTDKTTDDNGKKLTKDQQNFYKDSKIKDENGALITVYHTTTNPVIQFNEFNPVGTPGYLFGDNVVNYFTNEKMSSSYAETFEKADTKRLNNLQDVQEWFFDVGLPFFEVNNNTVYDNSGNPILKYNSFDELLRNLKSDIQREIGNEVNLQYEGYLNIKNPYVVESMDNAWSEVTKELNTEKNELIDLVKEHQEEIDNLMKESKQKRANFDLDEYHNINAIMNDLKFTTKMDSDLYYALSNNVLNGIENYTEAQKNAKKLGIELPSPDTKINELLEGKVYDKYAENRLKKFGNMTFSEFIEKYNKTNQNWQDFGGNDYFWFAKNFEKIVGKDVSKIQGWTENWESLYEAIDHNFDKEWLEEFTHEDLSTNDVVKRVLEMNKNLPENKKYDGVIFKEIYDYANELDEWEDTTPQDVYVTFNSNQFKAVDNTNPTSDPDIRYSQKADKWRKFVEENFSTEGTKTYLNEKAEKAATKIKLEGKEGQKYFEEQGAPEKIAKVLSETPKKNKLSFDDVSEVTGSIYRNVVSKGGELERISKAVNKPNIKYSYDKMLRAQAEAQQYIGNAQTTLDYKKYKNFTDAKGNKVSMSLNDIRKDAKVNGISEQTLNEYLAHKLNEYRYKEGKPVFSEEITDENSTKITKQIEKEHPQIKRIAKNVWQFEQNQLKNLYDSGLISKERYKQLSKNKQYVRIQRDVPKNSKTKIITNKNGKVEINQPIQKAKGGNQDILPIMEGIAKYTSDLVKLERTNESMKELGKALSMGNTDTNIDAFTDEESFGVNPDLIKDNNDGTYSMTYFDNGVAVTVPVNKGIYDAYVTNKAVNYIEGSKPFKVLSYLPKKMSAMFRGLTTNNNPLFMLTNFFKDIGDAPFNSKYTKQFAKTYLSTEALRQVAGNGVYNQLYEAAGGGSDSYFVDGNFTDKKGNKVTNALKKVWSPIEKGNEIVETVPRVAEFIATIKANGYEVNSNGELVAQQGVKISKSANEVLNEALYNAAEITTNFKRGGDVSKFLNRNGATFLNASIQGFDKQIRNFKDALSSGDKKQVVSLLLKALIFGIAPTMLNDAVNGDDDEYKEMQEYQKDNYYLFKFGDKWIRIPKGRAMSVLGSAYRRTKNFIGGDKNAYEGFLKFASNQVAPNSVFKNNILAPLSQVKENTSWSGNSIIPSSKINKPTEQQYNEKTDEISKFIGNLVKDMPVSKEAKKEGWANFKSPMAINYLLDQYTGVIGDVALPMLSQKSTSEYSPLLAPLVNKFTTDQAYNSTAVNNYYDKKNELYESYNDDYAKPIDKAKYNYISNSGSEMAKLYAKQREIQGDTSLSKKEKYKQAREVQVQINELAKQIVKDVDKVSESKYYAKIGDTYYKKVIKDGKETYVKDTSKNIPTENYALYDYFKSKYDKSKE